MLPIQIIRENARLKLCLIFPDVQRGYSNAPPVIEPLSVTLGWPFMTMNMQEFSLSLHCVTDLLTYLQAFASCKKFPTIIHKTDDRVIAQAVPVTW